MTITTHRSRLKINENLLLQPLWATIPIDYQPMGSATGFTYFQQLMNKALAGVFQAFCNLDDVIVMSHNPIDHERTLNQVFT